MIDLSTSTGPQQRLEGNTMRQDQACGQQGGYLKIFGTHTPILSKAGSA